MRVIILGSYAGYRAGERRYAAPPVSESRRALRYAPVYTADD